MNTDDDDIQTVESLLANLRIESWTSVNGNRPTGVVLSRPPNPEVLKQTKRLYDEEIASR